MDNKYLNRMMIQPDYVVVYDADKKFYHGNTLGKEDYKKLQYDMLIHADKVKMLVGYAASKSHPNEPVKVYISLDMRNINGDRLEHKYIRVYKVIDGQSVQYEGKHDLFIYSDYNTAILAGKEMAAYDEINTVVNNITDRVCEYFADAKFNRNFDFKWLCDKYNAYKRDYFRKDADEMLEKVVNATKNNVKDLFDVDVNKVTDYVKSGVERFLDELKKDNERAPMPKKEFTENDITLYKQITDDYAVLLRHRKRNGKSLYTVNIIKLSLDTKTTYEITHEQFCDIYELLNENVDGRLKFNSIMDVLEYTTIDNHPMGMDYNSQNDKTCENKYNSCDADKVNVKSNCDEKPKFAVGDRVQIKVGLFRDQYGTVINIVNFDNDNLKPLYRIEYDNKKLGSEIYYSWELDKVNNDTNNIKEKAVDNSIEPKKSTLFTHKFKIGDTVRVNNKARKFLSRYLNRIGTVDNITHTGCKTLYFVKFLNGHISEIRSFYSNELDVAQKPQKQVIVSKLKINDTIYDLTAATANHNDELVKKIEEHDKILKNILDTLKQLNNEK